MVLKLFLIYLQEESVIWALVDGLRAGYNVQKP